ncbi:MAG: bifunctional phosphopantothenoylcysteine decarboxylase/phosphopantothenate--cysteine ligase CoaBC [Myxococcales bacterium]|nr:bifunctional phosphopantothenoylcysteine decarboxylase/phosphopantothenate--cysteine ligase CoaBC [Myxococcales bacterium]
MSKNILFKISGSIAAYKSAILISRLVQDGHQVQCVATPAALKFIGSATLEGLTRRPVLSDLYEQGRMMEHIDLNRWADLTILAPATANRINRMAHGLGDDLVSALFLAHDFKKPYFVAPAMNSKMLEHPSTQEGLNKLCQWGVTILSPTEGSLACGETGSGRMQEPEDIYQTIVKEFSASDKEEAALKVLVTGGGTKEDIDGVRFLSNLSTGKTACTIATHLHEQGHEVTFLQATGSAQASEQLTVRTFSDFTSLANLLKEELKAGSYDALIHAAAVSDYSLEVLKTDEEEYPLPLREKLSSQREKINLELKRNPKLIDQVLSFNPDKKTKLVGFKFTNTTSEKEQKSQIEKLFAASKADLIVHNDKTTRVDDEQRGFQLYAKPEEPLAVAANAQELAIIIEQTLASPESERLSP